MRGAPGVIIVCLCRDDLQQSVQEAYDYSKQSAQRAYEYSQQGALQLGQQARNGYVGIQDAAGNLGSRVYHGGGYLYDSSAQLAAGGWERAQAWIPGSNKVATAAKLLVWQALVP